MQPADLGVDSTTSMNDCVILGERLTSLDLCLSIWKWAWLQFLLLRVVVSIQHTGRAKLLEKVGRC